MKTSVDIPDKELRELLKNTGAKSKSMAVNIAIAEYNRRCRAEKLIKLFGKMDGIMTQEELRRMREES